MDKKDIPCSIKSVSNDYELIDGKWKLVSLLGEGTFGKVYKAVDIFSNIENYCVIKIVNIYNNIDELKKEGLSEKDIELFLKIQVKEVLYSISLMYSLNNCKNIVNVFKHFVYEEVNNRRWDILVQMELLTPITSYFIKMQPTEQDFINLAIDICCALEYCEKLGVVHRDVKKENIFVSSEGIYKLGDFGIAMFLDDMDKTMSAKGTYTCIAPEVYKNGDYSFSSDIYSLGIVLYCFMNNNRMPFLPSDVSVNITHGDREEAIFKRLNGGTISPPQNASEEFSKIIIKACSYEKSSRYKSASELKKDLLLITNKNISLKPMIFKKDLSYDKTEVIGEYNTQQIFKQSFAQTQNKNIVYNRLKKGFPFYLKNKVTTKMINWICFTCMFSLLPLCVSILFSVFFGKDISFIDKCITDFLYFGVTISIITIREMVTFELWKKEQNIFLLTLFIMLLVLFLSSVFFGVMKTIELGLLNAKITYIPLFKGAGILCVASFLVGTFIQIWEER